MPISSTTHIWNHYKLAQSLVPDKFVGFLCVHVCAFVLQFAELIPEPCAYQASSLLLSPLLL